MNPSIDGDGHGQGSRHVVIVDRPVDIGHQHTTKTRSSVVETGLGTLSIAVESRELN